MNIMYKIINTLFTLLLILPVMGQTSDLNNSFRITANREDGRFSSSRGAVQYMLKQKPAFTFKSGIYGDGVLRNGSWACVPLMKD